MMNILTHDSYPCCEPCMDAFYLTCYGRGELVFRVVKLVVRLAAKTMEAATVAVWVDKLSPIVRFWENKWAVRRKVTVLELARAAVAQRRVWAAATIARHVPQVLEHHYAPGGLYERNRCVDWGTARAPLC